MKNMIKIGMIGFSYEFGSEGGDASQKARSTSKIIRNLYASLEKLSNKGIKVEKIEIKDGFARKYFGENIAMYIATLFMDFSKYNIVLIPLPRLMFPLFRNDTKFVSIIHGFNEIDTMDYPFLKRIGKRVLDNLIIKAAKKNGYALVISSLVEKDIIERGFDKNKIFYIGNAIEDKYFTEPKNNKKGRKFIVGYVGTMRKRKNIKFAIEGFQKLEGDDYEFHIYGNPIIRDGEIAKLVSKDSRIKLMGFAPEEKLVSIYDSFDAMVFPTLYEVFELPILEAQSRGIPVIVYKMEKLQMKQRNTALRLKRQKIWQK